MTNRRKTVPTLWSIKIRLQFWTTSGQKR